MPETSRFDCRSCNLTNNIDDMVECEDGCGGWYHYGCVGFDEGKEEEHWKCSNCVAKNVANSPKPGSIGGHGLNDNPASSQKGLIDPSAERVKRNLKLLEEQQSFLLREVELEQKREFEKKKLQLEKEAWRIRYELLNTQTGQSQGGVNELGIGGDWANRLSLVASSFNPPSGASNSDSTSANTNVPVPTPLISSSLINSQASAPVSSSLASSAGTNQGINFVSMPPLF